MKLWFAGLVRPKQSRYPAGHGTEGIEPYIPAFDRPCIAQVLSKFASPAKGEHHDYDGGTQNRRPQAGHKQEGDGRERKDMQPGVKNALGVQLKLVFRRQSGDGRDDHKQKNRPEKKCTPPLRSTLRAAARSVCAPLLFPESRQRAARDGSEASVLGAGWAAHGYASCSARSSPTALSSTSRFGFFFMYAT